MRMCESPISRALFHDGAAHAQMKSPFLLLMKLHSSTLHNFCNAHTPFRTPACPLTNHDSCL